MADLKAKIDKDFKLALLERDQLRISVLSGLRATILDEEIAQHKRQEGLADQSIEGLIIKEIKKRKESGDIYEKANRLELAKVERAEASFLEKYLPEQLDDVALEKIINEIINSFNDVTLKNMGQIISIVKTRVGNSVEPQRLAQLVKNKINK